MTTAIVLETSKGNLTLALGLGLVVIRCQYHGRAPPYLRLAEQDSGLFWHDGCLSGFSFSDLFFNRPPIGSSGIDASAGITAGYIAVFCTEYLRRARERFSRLSRSSGIPRKGRERRTGRP